MSDRPKSAGAHGSLRGNSPSRPRVGEYEIDYALARRHRVGWQNLAAQLGVNEADLRAKCERRLAILRSADHG